MQIRRGKLMFRNAMVAVAALLLFVASGLAQDNWDVNLGGAAVVTKQATGNGTTQTATKSGAYLITARHRFTARSSVELNYARTANSQEYLSSPLNFRIQGTVGEISGAYVFSLFQTPKLQPFLLAGAGVLIFYPSYSSNTINGVQTYLPAVRQSKPAFLYGGGVDYAVFSSLPLVRGFPLSNHLALRLQYRGLVYKAPDFGIQNLFTGEHGHMAEPSLGLVVKF